MTQPILRSCGIQILMFKVLIYMFWTIVLKFIKIKDQQNLCTHSTYLGCVFKSPIWHLLSEVMQIQIWMLQWMLLKFYLQISIPSPSYHKDTLVKFYVQFVVTVTCPWLEHIVSSNSTWYTFFWNQTSESVTRHNHLCIVFPCDQQSSQK